MSCTIKISLILNPFSLYKMTEWVNKYLTIFVSVINSRQFCRAVHVFSLQRVRPLIQTFFLIVFPKEKARAVVKVI